MTALPPAFFLPINQVFSEDQSQFLIQITKLYADIARNTNSRDIAIYDLTEVQDGQQWYTPGNPQVKRSNFRKTIPIPALAAGLNIIPHGITVGSPTTYVFTFINGVIFRQSAPPLFVPIPNDNVHVDVDQNNINITIPALYVGFTGNMVLEFLKQS